VYVSLNGIEFDVSTKVCVPVLGVFFKLNIFPFEIYFFFPNPLLPSNWLHQRGIHFLFVTVQTENSLERTDQKLKHPSALLSWKV